MLWIQIHWIWIQIRIQDFGPIWIQIQEAPEYGSNMDPDPQHWYSLWIVNFYLKCYIHIRNTDPDPDPGSSWIRIQYGSRSTTLIWRMRRRRTRSCRRPWMRRRTTRRCWRPRTGRRRGTIKSRSWTLNLSGARAGKVKNGGLRQPCLFLWSNMTLRAVYKGKYGPKQSCIKN